LFPQIVTTSAAVTLDNLPWGLVRGLVMVSGTIAALLVFSPRSTSKNGETAPTTSTRPSLLRRVGEFFIIVALAAAFAGAITTGLTLWVERWSAVLTVLREALSLIGG
jgi:type IV secretory pathway TrbD component